MKKFFLFCSILSVSIIAVISLLLQDEKSSEISDLALANIEALANGESGSEKRVICYNHLKGLQGAPMEDKTWCDDCKPRAASEWSKQNECTTN